VRWIAVASAAALIVVLFAVLRPEATSNDATPTPTPTSTPTASPTDTGSPSPTPEPDVTLIAVTVRGGTVLGPSRPTVRQGERVRIVVRADVRDHVHLHGYDVIADVAPGHPARIDFLADAAGVYEVELEDAGRLLFTLEILP
jgi:hypothetical protein